MFHTTINEILVHSLFKFDVFNFRIYRGVGGIITGYRAFSSIFGIFKKLSTKCVRIILVITFYTDVFELIT